MQAKFELAERDIKETVEIFNAWDTRWNPGESCPTSGLLTTRKYTVAV